MAEVRIKGRRASPGFAAGEIVVLSRTAAARVSTGEPAKEAQALDTAMKAAAGELADLARTSGLSIVVGYGIRTPAGHRNEAVTVDPSGALPRRPVGRASRWSISEHPA